MNKKRVLSCIQPTGEMHLGNYFGAVQNWVKMQSTYECYYGIVDYHALTILGNVHKLRTNTWNLAINLLAVGIKPEHLFVQSLVPEHAELAWIFNCFCSHGYLNKMTQFKDKSKSQSEGTKDGFISAGLFDYPVLQAADILIYKADVVPVGKDQEQHLELTREIARRFNHTVGKEYFVLPETIFTETPKVRSTADPTKKMSKSAGDKHYISLFSDENRIRKQIKSAVTDAGDTPAGEKSEGVDNLFEILIASSDNVDIIGQLKDAHRDGTLQYSDLKEATADAVIAMLTPFQERKKELESDKKTVKNQIKASSYEIRKTAQQTLREVKELAGLLNVRM